MAANTAACHKLSATLHLHRKSRAGFRIFNFNHRGFFRAGQTGPHERCGPSNILIDFPMQKGYKNHAAQELNQEGVRGIEKRLPVEYNQKEPPMEED
jgi:hypothetical protein